MSRLFTTDAARGVALAGSLALASLVGGSLAPPVSAQVTTTRWTGSRDAGAPLAWECVPDTLGGGQINPITGNKLTEVPLIRWRARGGIPVALTLYHNSQGQRAGALGAHWSGSFDIGLEVDTQTGDVTLHTGDDLSLTFARNLDGTFTPPRGIADTLQFVAGGYTLTTPAGLVYRFGRPNNAGWLCLSRTDRNGNALRLTYDSQDRPLRAEDPTGRALTFTYTAGRLSRITDPAGRMWNLTYDGAGDLIQLQRPAVDGAAPTLRFAYGALHEIVRFTDECGEDWLSRYDPNGVILAETDPLGGVTSYSYSPGQCVITDPLGAVTTVAYDSQGRVTSLRDPLGATLAYGYDAENHRTRITDAQGRVTALQYDSQGNTLSCTLPDGRVSRATYTAQNRPLTVTLASGKQIRFTYDAQGNPLTCTDPGGAITRWTYDATGQALTCTDPLGKTSAATYDLQGNPIRVVDPLGRASAAEYDPTGLLLRVIDPAGRVTAATYDGMGRVVRVTDPGGRAWSIAYDASGRRVRLVDPLGGAHNYAYDDAGRLSVHTDPLGRSVGFAYDAAGNLTTRTDARGKALRFTYDARRQHTATRYPDGAQIAYGYTLGGQLFQRTDARGIVTRYTYDATDRLTGWTYSDATPAVSLTYNADDQRTSLTDGNGTTTYQYDAAGRMTSRATPQGTVTYAYDAAGHLLSAGLPGADRTAYAYDDDGQIVQVTAPGNRIARYTYDASGNVLGATLPDGTTTGHIFDPASGDLTQIWHRSASGQTLARFDYLYDTCGRRVSETLAGGAQIDLRYDAAGQLTGETRSGTGGYALTYAYDAAGNRISRTGNGIAEAWTYDDANKLLSAGSRTYNYDAAGNVSRIADASTGAVLQLQWDAESRLTAVSGSRAAQYRYAGSGQRTARIAGGATENRLYLFDSVSGPLLRQGASVLSAGPQGPLTETAGSQQNTFHSDLLGTARLVTDGSGATIRTLETGAFGDTLGAAPGSAGFGASWDYESDSETGWMRHGMRLYDPVAGRYLSRDPLGAGYNHYLYAENDPVNAVDPLGLDHLTFQPTGKDIPTPGGGMTPGKLIWFDDDGKVIGRWPATSGGFRGGDSPVTPGQPTRLPRGSYKGSNPRRRSNPGMCRDGSGFSIDLDPNFPTNRSLIRIHPDGGRPGTQGCIGMIGSPRELDDFYRRMRERLKASPITVIVN